MSSAGMELNSSGGSSEHSNKTEALRSATGQMLLPCMCH